MDTMICTGLGYDVHRFGPDRRLVLGGVEIPHPEGLVGHSDADVLAHAVADAILGALGEPDIGHFFPPGDPACKDIDSMKILERCLALADARGATLHNIDATIIAEAPKVLPHAAAMKERLGKALRLRPKRIGIKATTNEAMGFVGRKEGVAAMAVATLSLPGDD